MSKLPLHGGEARKWRAGLERKLLIRLAVILLVVLAGLGISTHALYALTNSITNDDDLGQVTVFSTDTVNGIDLNNPFFQPLGTNGRTCNTCHRIEDGMSISTLRVQAVFSRTQGLAPLFRTNDGSDAPTGLYARVATLAERQTSFSMLLNHGTIRVDLPIPATADFSPGKFQDPYGYASPQHLSLFRRPLPAANLKFETTLMSDGREKQPGQSMGAALQQQANDATLQHAQASQPLTAAQAQAIVHFERNLFATQSSSNLVGALNAPGCTGCTAPRGDPVDLSQTLFFPGINDFFGPNFKNDSFLVFSPWADIPASDTSDLANNRRAIALGETIFYSRTFNISGVNGLNDVLGQPVIVGTCTTCHDTPDVANHSRPRFMNIGTADVTGNPLFTPDYPVYNFRRKSDQARVTVTDPGRALVTGQFADIAKFKVPVLRGLPARAPYFHNGQANTLTDVINFYNHRFNIGFTQQELDSLLLFLEQL